MFHWKIKHDTIRKCDALLSVKNFDIAYDKETEKTKNLTLTACLFQWRGVWDIMKRILLMVFRNIFLVPFMWCKLCYYASHVDKYTEEQHYKMLRFIVLRANKGGNVTIEVHGRENLPDKSGFMFFPNHL